MKKRSLRLDRKLLLLKDTIASLHDQEEVKGGATGISVCVTYCVSCGGTCTGPTNNTNLSVGLPCCKPTD